MNPRLGIAVTTGLYLAACARLWLEQRETKQAKPAKPLPPLQPGKPTDEFDSRYPLFKAAVAHLVGGIQ